jgi:hypothetical protein
MQWTALRCNDYIGAAYTYLTVALSVDCRPPWRLSGKLGNMSKAEALLKSRKAWFTTNKKNPHVMRAASYIANILKSDSKGWQQVEF